MKKFDISNITVSDIYNIYAAQLAEDSEASAVAEHSLLVVKTKGESIYTSGSVKCVADSEHIVFIPKGCSYSLYIGKAGDCTVIEFDTHEDCATYGLCSFNTEGDDDVADAVKELLHYWTLRGPAYRSKCLSELYGLFTQISSIQSFSSSLAGKYAMIHRSVKYIERYYSRQDLYTPMLAEMSGMGETYYRSIFIAVFGIAPTKYIQQYRVDKAKELLLKSDGSVEDIAVAVGFANSSYFCKVFKTVTGLTPSEFAEKGRLVG